MSLRTSYAQSTTEKMLSCAREIAEITCQDPSRSRQDGQRAAHRRRPDMFESMQKMFKGMPIGDNNALGSIQTAMDTARAAYEQMTKASTEAFQAFTKITPRSNSTFFSGTENGASGRRFCLYRRNRSGQQHAHRRFPCPVPGRPTDPRPWSGQALRSQDESCRVNNANPGVATSTSVAR
jgi:hypothetical protein